MVSQIIDHEISCQCGHVNLLSVSVGALVPPGTIVTCSACGEEVRTWQRLHDDQCNVDSGVFSAPVPFSAAAASTG